MKQKPAAKREPAAKTRNWRPGQIVWRNPKDLKPHPQNPKVHPPEQLRALAAVFKEFGFDQPILVDDLDTILKGHGRNEAALLGDLAEVPTIVRDGLTDLQKLALVISDNQLPTMGSFDQKLLRVGLTSLVKADFKVSLLGFTDIRLATFVGGAAAPGQSDPNEQPAVIERAVSRKGDVWQLGEHVLHCNDCSKVKLPESVRLQLADPPYELDTEGAGVISRKQDYSKKMAAAGVDKFDVDQVNLVAKTNIFFTSKALVPAYLQRAIAEDETWDLNVLHRPAAMPNNSGHFMTDLDYIVVIGSQAPARGLEHANYSKMLSLTTWDRPVPWAKPVEILTKYIRLFSGPGDMVLDGYCGSGSTIIACGMESRVCFGIEINPLFVDVAVRRWQKWSGKPATLQGSRKTFDAIERERAKKKPG